MFFGVKRWDATAWPNTRGPGCKQNRKYKIQRRYCSKKSFYTFSIYVCSTSSPIYCLLLIYLFTLPPPQKKRFED